MAIEKNIQPKPSRTEGAVEAMDAVMALLRKRRWERMKDDFDPERFPRPQFHYDNCRVIVAGTWTTVYRVDHSNPRNGIIQYMESARTNNLEEVKALVEKVLGK